VPTLERLVAGPHTVAVVVTQPDRPRGRGRHTSPSPVAQAAEAAGLALLRPERVAEPDFAEALRRHSPELGVVVAFGQFLPRRVREAPALGYCINGHASLLPAHRGAAPIPRAILAGDRTTGVSVMRVEREMDAGPVALAREIAIGEDENAGELAARLALLCADAIAEAVEAVAEDRIVWREQDGARATFAPKLERGEAVLDFRDGALALARRVRAFAPEPGATTTWRGQPLRILSARALEIEAGRPPGSVFTGGSPPLVVATGAGRLELRIVQRAGGRPLDAAAFLRGHPIPDGARLGG
jgi:methionyl-tRNA formyltransferase